jgi:2-keto-3-deoxy-L-rhamnonate aldolase RhmA
VRSGRPRNATAKLAATLASTPAWAGRFHAIGFRMFAYGLDVQLFQQALAAGIQSVRGLNRA